jgi:hypothetical protein
VEKISMQQLKEQRATPAEKFVLDTIKGVKASEPDRFGNVHWYNKDGVYVFEQMLSDNFLLIRCIDIWVHIYEGYGHNHQVVQERLTKLFYKYTNNGQLEVI